MMYAETLHDSMHFVCHA